MKISIEYDEYERFVKAFKEGKYSGQRFGQAFYNRFDLHKMNNQKELCKLYELDFNTGAELFIFNFFELH
jgi:hypothetical protein